MLPIHPLYLFYDLLDLLVFPCGIVGLFEAGAEEKGDGLIQSCG